MLLFGDNCWEELGIKKTADKRAIKTAYARLLKNNRPDGDPEAYQALREAYDAALRYAENQSGEARSTGESVAIDRTLHPTPEKTSPYSRQHAYERELYSRLAAGEEAAAMDCFVRLRDEGELDNLDRRYYIERRLVVFLADLEALPRRFIGLCAKEFNWSRFDNVNVLDLEDYQQESVLSVGLDENTGEQWMDFLDSLNSDHEKIVRDIVSKPFDETLARKMASHDPYKETVNSLLSWLDERVILEKTTLIDSSIVNWWLARNLYKYQPVSEDSSERGDTVLFLFFLILFGVFVYQFS